MAKLISYIVIISVFFSQLTYSQIGQLSFSWDKIGCQVDEVNKLPIDDNWNNSRVLYVCENSIVSYRIFGEGMQNVDHVDWLISGGTIEIKDEFAVVNWDQSIEGSIYFLIKFIDGSTTEKSLIVRQRETDLNLGWDKVGCQADVDKVNEIKFYSDHTLSAQCLKVCKKSSMTYVLSGNDTANISDVKWTATGGEIIYSETLKSTVLWNDSIVGSIKAKITFVDSEIIEKTFCVRKLDPSVLLEWEKIDKSSISEIKLDNPENDFLMAYPESTVYYKLGGNLLANVDSVYWEVHGGFAYLENGQATPISWFDDEDHYILLHLSYSDGTIVDQKIKIMIVAPGTEIRQEPNSIKFSYDLAGNQIRRGFIYLASRHSKPKDETKSGGRKLIRDDLYKDISYYPNPVKSELYIEWINQVGKTMSSMELYNLNGNQVAVKKNMNTINDTTIDFSEYPDGIYTLILNYAGGDTKTLKIVKQ